MTGRPAAQGPELVLERARRVLLGIAVVSPALSVVLFQVFPARPGLTQGLPWLGLMALAAALAFRLHRHPASSWLAFVASCCGVIFVYPAHVPVSPGTVIAASPAIALWSGLVLPPVGALATGLFIFVAPWVFGVEVTYGLQPMASGQLPFSLHLTTVLIPLSLALVMRDAQSRIVRALMDRFDSLSEHEGELSARVARQAEQLDLSQQKLAQAQKLETVGTMASGLAHELNNLLTPIRGMAELVASDAEDAVSRRYGRRILDAAESAASITGALLTYARKGSFSPVRTNLKALIEGQVLPVLSQSVPEAVRLVTELDPKLSVDVDRVLFQQCVTNLVFNAVDAMPNGGDLKVRLFEDAGAVPLTDSGTDHGAVVVEVIDSGDGMDAATIEHAFDPFFTTKAVGTGTGLGLAMVQGCVKRHGGEIEIESTPGVGSTFRLRFPLGRAPVPSRPWPVLGDEKNKPVVVVASQDEDTRDELEEMLSDLSCTPIVTGELPTVRNMLAEVGERVDLLIVDHRDELDSHRRFVRDARTLLPDLPVTVLTSGGRDPNLDRLLGPAAVRFVRAPVDPTVLGAMLSELLRPAGYELPYWALPAAGSRTSMSSMDVFDLKRAELDAKDALESEDLRPGETAPQPSHAGDEGPKMLEQDNTAG